MLRIRQVNEQQINAALNDIDKSIGSMQTEAASVKKSVAEENKNTQKVIEGLSKRLDNKLSDLDSAIGNNIEYINNHFVPNTRTVNGKSLSNNIELTASDVGAATVNDITNAINDLDAASAGGAGKYISEISESNGKISATATTMDTTPTANSTNAVTSGGVKSAIDTAESNAKNLANATGTLPVANGGTGATTAGGACTNLIGALTVANGDVTDNTDVITSNADGYAEQSDKQFYKRKGIKFWNYIKSKISSVLGLTASNYGGKAATAGSADTATASNRVNAAYITIKTGSTAQSKISLNTLMTWLMHNDRKYIPSNTACYRTILTTWSYAGNDILRLSANGVSYELQLAGVVIEFLGTATSYTDGVFRLRIHSSPTTSFTATSGYTVFPTNRIAEYTCNGSGYTPTWRIVGTDAKMANGFWGMTGPDYNDTVWIRSTNQGLIPYQSGNAGSGHCYLGTSTWYWKYAYIDEIYGHLNGNATTATTATIANRIRTSAPSSPVNGDIWIE